MVVCNDFCYGIPINGVVASNMDLFACLVTLHLSTGRLKRKQWPFLLTVEVKKSLIQVLFQILINTKILMKGRIQKAKTAIGKYTSSMFILKCSCFLETVLFGC